MRSRGEFDRIRSVLSETATDEPLTAREIRDLLEEHGVEVDSPHRIATVLGRRAEHGEVDVIRGSPYRYHVDSS